MEKPTLPSKIKLYSTTTCPYCVMEKQWLDQNKINHEVVYVDRDPKAAIHMVKSTKQMGVPVTELEYQNSETKFVIGFNKMYLQELLNIK